MEPNPAPTERRTAPEADRGARGLRPRRARGAARRRGRARLGMAVLAVVVALAAGWAIVSATGSGGGTSGRVGSRTTFGGTGRDDDLRNEATAAAAAYSRTQPRPSDWGLSPAVLQAVPLDAAVRRATTTRKVVALTFDDGPSEYSAPLLAELKDLGVPVTFFVVGRQIAGFESVVASENTLGHVVGNHTWAHENLAMVKRKGILRSQVADASEAIFRATGRRPTLFRPPYGATTRAVDGYLRTRGLLPTIWDVDSEDWRGIGREAIVHNVLSAVGPGSIVLLHDGGGDRRPTLAAVPRIVEMLRGQGYTFATVPHLLDAGPPAATSSSFSPGNG